MVNAYANDLKKLDIKAIAAIEEVEVDISVLQLVDPCLPGERRVDSYEILEQRALEHKAFDERAAKFLWRNPHLIPEPWRRTHLLFPGKDPRFEYLKEQELLRPEDESCRLVCLFFHRGAWLIAFSYRDVPHGGVDLITGKLDRIVCPKQQTG